MLYDESYVLYESKSVLISVRPQEFHTRSLGYYDELDGEYWAVAERFNAGKVGESSGLTKNPEDVDVFVFPKTTRYSLSKLDSFLWSVYGSMARKKPMFDKVRGERGERRARD